MASDDRPAFIPAICYRDPKRMYRWLEEAFGFEPEMVITGADDELLHSEMRLADGLIIVCAAWGADLASPASMGGKSSQFIHVHLDTDLDTHCRQARKAGAEIVQEPEDQFYGDRTYRARDPEGHLWTFGQTVRDVSVEEADAAMPGIKTRRRLG